MSNIIKTITKIFVMLFLIQIIFAFGNTSKASFWGDIFSQGQEFFNKGKNASESGEIVVSAGEGDKNNTTIHTPSNTEVKGIIENIYSILFPLGVAVTVIMGGVLGIKFMMESAEGKAQVKESLVPYVISCIVIYGAFGIWKICIIIFSAVA